MVRTSDLGFTPGRQPQASGRFGVRTSNFRSLELELNGARSNPRRLLELSRLAPAGHALGALGGGIVASPLVVYEPVDVVSAVAVERDPQASAERLRRVW